MAYRFVPSIDAWLDRTSLASEANSTPMLQVTTGLNGPS